MQSEHLKCAGLRRAECCSSACMSSTAIAKVLSVAAGAINVPFTSLLEGEVPSGLFKAPRELQDVLAQAGVDLERPLICSCGSGATAAVLSHAIALAQASKQSSPCTVRSLLSVSDRLHSAPSVVSPCEVYASQHLCLMFTSSKNGKILVERTRHSNAHTRGSLVFRARFTTDRGWSGQRPKATPSSPLQRSAEMRMSTGPIAAWCHRAGNSSR